MSWAILGLDPGFSSYGWALLQAGVAYGGVIRTQKAPNKRRLLAVEDNLARTRELVAALKRRLVAVDVVVAEAMSFPRSSSVAAKVALAWGATIALVEEAKRPLFQVTPQEVKRALCGARNASKEDVQHAVIKRLDGATLHMDVPSTQREHVYDALAVIYTCEHTWRPYVALKESTTNGISR